MQAQKAGPTVRMILEMGDEVAGVAQSTFRDVVVKDRAIARQKTTRFCSRRDSVFRLSFKSSEDYSMYYSFRLFCGSFLPGWWESYFLPPGKFSSYLRGFLPGRKFSSYPFPTGPRFFESSQPSSFANLAFLFLRRDESGPLCGSPGDSGRE